MKTIICDIDGTLTKYMGGGHWSIANTEHQSCEGAIEHMRKWEAQGHRIILITGRRESVRERTESELRRLGIPFDILLMGYADSGRILTNDLSPGLGTKCHAVPGLRDGDWNKVNWGAVGLDNA